MHHAIISIPLSHQHHTLFSKISRLDTAAELHIANAKQVGLAKAIKVAWRYVAIAHAVI